MDNRKKRSFTEIHSFAKTKSINLTNKIIRHSSILYPITEHNRLYNPGPKPSKLLLEYLKPDKKKELPRILEIKQTVHRKTRSLQIVSRKIII